MFGMKSNTKKTGDGKAMIIIRDQWRDTKPEFVNIYEVIEYNLITRDRHDVEQNPPIFFRISWKVTLVYIHLPKKRMLALQYSYVASICFCSSIVRNVRKIERNIKYASHQSRHLLHFTMQCLCLACMDTLPRERRRQPRQIDNKLECHFHIDESRHHNS